MYYNDPATPTNSVECLYFAFLISFRLFFQRPSLLLNTIMEMYVCEAIARSNVFLPVVIYDFNYDEHKLVNHLPSC